MQALYPEARADFLSESRTVGVGRISEGKQAAGGAETAWCCPDTNGWYWKRMAPCPAHCAVKKSSDPLGKYITKKAMKCCMSILGNDEET